MMEDAGQKLKKARERLNLRYRDVEEASARIAERHDNVEFALALSRLADIENKGTIPSIYRLYSLSAIYRLNIHEVLGWYGIDFGGLAADSQTIEVDRTHLYGFDSSTLGGEASVPLAVEPGVDLSKTVFLSRVIQKWGKLPLALLNGIDLKEHLYGLVGMDDWTMFPLIRPGSLILIDETQTTVLEEGWTTEQERPIYFIEHRRGYFLGWCSIAGDKLILQPHPMSQVPAEVFQRQEIEIIGRVVGVAMRLTPTRRRRTRS